MQRLHQFTYVCALNREAGCGEDQKCSWQMRQAELGQVHTDVHHTVPNVHLPVPERVLQWRDATYLS